MVSFTSGEATSVLVSVLIALAVARRSYAMTRGVPYAAWRLVVLPVLIGVVWVATILESLLLIPWSLPYLVALDVALLLASAFVFTGIAERHTVAYRDERGVWHYRIGFALAGLFLGLYLVRLGVAVALFPTSLEFGSPPGGYPPFPQQLVLAVIDALFSTSVGLLLGRSAGAARKLRIERGRATPPAAR